MALLQIRNLPDDLHARLRERARADGTTMSELAARLLARELSMPTMADWLADVTQRPARAGDVDIEQLMDDVRVELDDDPTAPDGSGRRGG